jgi:hypothetical protein
MNLTDPCVWNRFPWSILGSPCVNISITHCVIPKASAIRKACASVNMEQPMHMVSFTGAYRDSRLAGLSLWRWAEVNDQVIPRSCLAGACHDLCNFRLVPIFDLCWFPKTAGNESAYVNPNFEVEDKYRKCVATVPLSVRLAPPSHNTAAGCEWIDSWGSKSL